MKYSCFLIVLCTATLASGMQQEKDLDTQTSFETLAKEWHAVHEEISATSAALERLTIAVKDMYIMQCTVQKQHTQLHPLTYSHTPPTSDRLELCQSGTPHNDMVQKLDQELRLVHCTIAHEIRTLPSQQEALENKLTELIARKQAITSEIEKRLVMCHDSPTLTKRISERLYLTQTLPQSVKNALFALGYSR